MWSAVVSLPCGAATDDAGSLGVYYKCFFGANAHFGLTEDDSFAMEDDKGRSWICHPIKREDVEALDLFKDFPAIKGADEKIGGRNGRADTVQRDTERVADEVGGFAGVKLRFGSQENRDS